MKYVNYEQAGFIGIITLDRQAALNALNLEMLEEINEVFDNISLRDTRCVIITGAGKKAFVAGADIAAMHPLDRQGGEDFSLKGNKLFLKIDRFPLPVIAAVNGYALGGGCELALSCDIRIASENALFAQPEASLGITAGFGATQRLPRLVGIGMAKELLYSSARIDAAEAFRIGLVNRVYPLSELMNEVLKLAEKIAEAAPVAVQANKRAINEGLDTNIESGINIEAALFGSCFETQDQKKAMSAFLEKRKPEPFTNS